MSEIEAALLEALHTGDWSEYFQLKQVLPEKFEEIKAYRQILCDIPAQPGAPWDGGGELTPWPIIPNMSI